ncbi:MAG: hypothetical protein QOI11_2513 [Candidatus Eremiobacteraeota bacterium]|nr:hypothetical protein [Candidatus Eremiobacteraeota bacterium]
MSGKQHETGLSRRELLQRGAVAGVATGAFGLPADVFAKRRSDGRKVAVLGGGMAGLAAAHELAERGFRVTVYEPVALGGKARSIPVPHTSKGGRRRLPGEHGFRFFPGFYHHVPDTMRRIPFAGNAGGVRDNLVAANGGKFLRAKGRPDAGPFGIGPDPGTLLTVDGLRDQLLDLLSGNGVPPAELAFFVNKLLVFVTSSEERRFGQWEHTTWWDFVEAKDKSQEYKTVIAAGLTRNVVAAKETVASTRTIGHMGEAFVWNILGLGNDGALDRVLSAPTNEAWIDPWVAHLKKLGVKFQLGQRVDALHVAKGRISGARVHDARGRHREVEADWFVCAMPVERARRLWSRKILKADPSLESMNRLYPDWMVGIQYYLKRRVDITPGHMAFIDAPWALTALTQGQFWARRDFKRDYGDGTVADCLSVDISNWDAPGILYGKPAKLCTKTEIANEVWAQVKAHQTAGRHLPDDIRHSYFLDPGITWDRKRKRNNNATPLLVNTAGSWDDRPKAPTKIPNLFLAGDYVQTDLDLATMEGANESGRAAVNALLDAAGSNAAKARKYKLYNPPELEPLKRIDAQRFKAHQPNLLDLG